MAVQTEGGGVGNRDQDAKRVETAPIVEAPRRIYGAAVVVRFGERAVTHCRKFLSFLCKTCTIWTKVHQIESER